MTFAAASSACAATRSRSTRSQEIVVRIEFWGDEIERITEVDPLTGEVLADRTSVDIYPASYFVTSRDEARGGAASTSRPSWRSRSSCSRSRTSCSRRTAAPAHAVRPGDAAGDRLLPGVENYSRHLSRREAGSTPWTLLDYFPDDFVLLRRRVAHDRSAGARHVQRRPRAQGGPGRLRLPPAVRAGQSAADVPRVRATLARSSTSRPRRARTSWSTASRSSSSSFGRPACSIPRSRSSRPAARSTT